MCDRPLSTEDVADMSLQGVSRLVDELVVAITSRRIYWAEHPRVKTSIESLLAMVQRQFEETQVESLALGYADGYLFFRKQPLLGASLSAPHVIRPLEALHSGGVRFDKDASEQDLLGLVDLLGRKQLRTADWMEANAELERLGCAHVKFLPEYDPTATELDATEVPKELFATVNEDMADEALFHLSIPVELYQDVVHHLQDVMVQASRGDSLQIGETQHLVSTLLSRLTEDPKSMLGVSRYEQYDAFTFGHSIRVALLALEFARSITDDAEALHRIGIAALLHDVGKAWVPFDILYCRGRLTDEERVEMSKHSAYGAEMLLDAKDADPLAVSIAFGHHRMLRQGGYPETVHDARLSRATSLIKVCDVYEALTAVRPYKPRMSPLRAYRIMMDMKGHFEPAILRRFIEVTGLYPTGSRVQTTTGEVARVCGQTDDVERPIVQVEVDPEGRPASPGANGTWDLSAPEHRDRRGVAEILLDAEM